MKNEDTQNIDEKSEFQINTATVYDGLSNKWYDEGLKLPSKVYEEIKFSIKILLRDKRVSSHVDWQEHLGNLYDYIFKRIPRIEVQAENPEYFPIPNTMIFHVFSGALHSSLLESKENEFANNLKKLGEEYTVLFLDADGCIVERNDEYFNLFFAFQLFVIDIYESDEFLQYHLQNSFENNIEDYQSFLEKLSIKYKYLDTIPEIVHNYITRLTTLKNDSIQPVEEQTKEAKPSLRQQVLALNYLFDELEISADRTVLTDFVKLVTGKEAKTKAKDGNIYKILSSPFPQSDKALIKDLQFIRPFFEKLNLHKIVEKINKEINSKI